MCYLIQYVVALYLDSVFLVSTYLGTYVVLVAFLFISVLLLFSYVF